MAVFSVKVATSRPGSGTDIGDDVPPTFALHGKGAVEGCRPRRPLEMDGGFAALCFESDIGDDVPPAFGLHWKGAVEGCRPRRPVQRDRGEAASRILHF